MKCRLELGRLLRGMGILSDHVVFTPHFLALNSFWDGCEVGLLGFGELDWETVGLLHFTVSDGPVHRLRVRSGRLNGARR